ncbi:Os04g0142100 [Oryza sativa Japonica Group]|uniref:Os04g0142100 protein n=1 Tax=Oryza sativa subsp. japonica TaxID=39947 RepID=A0A0P0W6Z7_ORYSJ|nr:Os04g0142100 [Oryza sativa Japonica Group]
MRPTCHILFHYSPLSLPLFSLFYVGPTCHILFHLSCLILPLSLTHPHGGRRGTRSGGGARERTRAGAEGGGEDGSTHGAGRARMQTGAAAARTAARTRPNARGVDLPLPRALLSSSTRRPINAFNKRVGDLRHVAVDAFARLKARWACLQNRTEVKLQDLPVVLGT